MYNDLTMCKSHLWDFTGSINTHTPYHRIELQKLGFPRNEMLKGSIWIQEPLAKTPHFCTKKCSEDGNNDFVILFNFKSISSIVLREPIKNYLADFFR